MACSQPNGSSSDASLNTLDGGNFDQLKNQDSVIVLDVRTPAEWESGVIEGVDQFADINNPGAFEESIKNLNPEFTYLIYCRSGSRSAMAGQELIARGFKKVNHLGGGIMGYKGKIVAYQMR